VLGLILVPTMDNQTIDPNKVGKMLIDDGFLDSINGPEGPTGRTPNGDGPKTTDLDGILKCDEKPKKKKKLRRSREVRAELYKGP